MRHTAPSLLTRFDAPANMRGMANPYDKNRAAKYLKMSLRTFQRLVSERVAAGYEPEYTLGKTGQKKAVYSKELLDQWKQERAEQKEEMLHSPATTALAPVDAKESAIIRGVQASPALVRLMEEFSKMTDDRAAHVPVSEKPLLKAREVQALTGLSYRQVMDAYHAKELKGALIGRAVRFRRADVDKWLSKLF